MREIVNISSGNCGNSLGLNFWESINDEHGVAADGKFQGSSDLQLERIYVYYHEGYNANQFIPRNIAVDLDPAKIDFVRGSPVGGMFPASHTISGHSGGSNNFAKGYFSDGVSLLPALMDCLRHELETSDCPQGIQMCHALGGGTGAGLSALILDAVRDENPELVTPTFSVVPTPKVSDIVIEPYNAILAMSHLLTSADMIFCLDNEALLASCMHGLRISAPTYGDLNHIIANAMSGITTSLRFPGQLNSGLRKLATNCIPFPRYQWFIPSFVPLIPRAKHGQRRTPLANYSIPEMVRDMFSNDNSMCAVDMTKGQFLTASAIFRGRMSTREVENSIMQVQQRNSSSFVPWIPDNMKTSICDIAPRGMQRSATFFANNSAISVLMLRVLRQYRSMFRRQAFLHWFYGEGMEEQDFLDAETNVYDIAEDYSRIRFGSRLEDDSSDDEAPEMEPHGVKDEPEKFVLQHSDDKIQTDANNSCSPDQFFVQERPADEESADGIDEDENEGQAQPADGEDDDDNGNNSNATRTRAVAKSRTIAYDGETDATSTAASYRPEIYGAAFGGVVTSRRRQRRRQFASSSSTRGVERQQQRPGRRRRNDDGSADDCADDDDDVGAVEPRRRFRDRRER